MQSAELTGKLDETLESLAGYLEREVETRSKVVSALSYPGVVMVMALFTVVVLAGYVLPQFKPLFEELNADLPFTTRSLLFVATLFTMLWYIPFSCFCAFIAVDDVGCSRPTRAEPSRTSCPARSRSSRASSSTRSSSASVASSARW